MQVVSEPTLFSEAKQKVIGKYFEATDAVGIPEIPAAIAGVALFYGLILAGIGGAIYLIRR